MSITISKRLFYDNQIHIGSQHWTLTGKLNSQATDPVARYVLWACYSTTVWPMVYRTGKEAQQGYIHPNSEFWA